MPVKFETVTFPEMNHKQTAKRKSSDFNTIPAKHIKLETKSVMLTNKNHNLTKRINSDAISLIPIQKSSPSLKKQVIDIHKPTCCKQCGEVFPNAYGCLRHKQQVHLNGSMKVSPDSLKVYNSIFLSSDRTVCPICSKPTKASSWNRHLLIHSAEKNFTCTYCKKDFHRKDHLKNHLKTHGVTEL